MDSPVGTGFSYGRTEKASHSTDIQTFEQDCEFIRKVLIKFFYSWEKKPWSLYSFFIDQQLMAAETCWKMLPC